MFDADRKFAAIGLYDPGSPVRLKILHAGSPVTIDDDWWQRVFTSALERRQVFADGPDTPNAGYRLVNGENDGIPGLIVDRYADVLVVKLYTPALFPHLRSIVIQLVAVTDCRAVVLRLARTVQRGETHGLTDGDVIAGSLDDEPVVFLEAGLRFEADVRHGQKTGWFLDQRANRVTVGSMAGGHDVLDVFAAGGGFSVHAAAGGARSVHSVDIAGPAIAATVRNMELNHTIDAVRACTHTVDVGDAFDVMADLAREHRRYGIVVIDPPSFAQRQASVDTARRAYTRLTHLAIRLVEPGACSCRRPARVGFPRTCSSRRSKQRRSRPADR